MYVVCPGKMLVDIHPKILGASCVFYFIVIDFYSKNYKIGLSCYWEAYM